MDLGLKGKVAIVTASSRGIGRAAAEALAAEGARIAMCARTTADVMAAADQIRAHTGGEVLAVAADLSKAEDIQRVVDRTVEAYGTVNIVVNNAGGPAPGGLDGVGETEWRAAFEITLLKTTPTNVRPKNGERWGRPCAVGREARGWSEDRGTCGPGIGARNSWTTPGCRRRAHGHVGSGSSASRGSGSRPSASP